MIVTTFSAREFNQDVGKAKKATRFGPVFVTDRGKPAHVLLCFADYQRLSDRHRNIADALAMPGIEDIEFAPQPARIKSTPADFG